MLAHIEGLTKEYAAKKGNLNFLVCKLQDDITRLKRSQMEGIKSALSEVAEIQGSLQRTIRANPRLFDDPRTYTFHEVKVGLQKGKGGMEWDDEQQVLRLIRKHLPDQAEVLIRVKESVAKAALQSLDAASLKRIGVTVRETGDQVVIRPMDGEVEKLVDALLADLAAEEEAQAAEAGN